MHVSLHCLGGSHSSLCLAGRDLSRRNPRRRQDAIYRDADDRRVFLGLLSLAAEEYEWTCHSFCLMTNHYHLVVDTTREYLSDGL